MLLALLALLAAPSPSIAPLTADRFDALSKGTIGLEFGFPTGGGRQSVGLGSSTIGVTYLLNDNMALRGDFGLEATLSSGGGPAAFTIGAGLRMYQLRKGPV